MDDRPRHRLLRRLARPLWFGVARRTKPLSDVWGRDRGHEIDRYYIERFLLAHRSDIQGRVIEVKDSRYTERFGGRVEQSDVLDIDPANPRATIVADLANLAGVHDNIFDCFVLTQTLQLLFDLRAAVVQIHRVLKPGGVLLCTVPGLCRIERAYADRDYWRFTAASCRRLFADVFGVDGVTVQSYGNVLTAMAFLTGLACEELTSRELDDEDPYFPVVLAIRAIKQSRDDP